MENKNFNLKIQNFIFNKEIERDKFIILEFGVREGRSTKMFLDMIKKKSGNLISIDIDDYSHLFSNENWKFIKTRDDNIHLISKSFDQNFNIILIDSLHEPSHVLNLINNYWKFLEINGSLYVDDISWIPYSKGNWRDHEYTENINYDTFETLLNLLNSNMDKFTLEFNFQASGMARLTKISDETLSKPKKIIRRNNLIKKLLKKVK